MNKKLMLVIIMLFTVDIFAHNGTESVVNKTIVKNGIGLGSVIAVVVSWDRNKSILFAIIHGAFSWLYVIYYYLFYKIVSS